MRAVSKRFGRVSALRGVDLTIHPGESVAFWGSNGAGKTTLIRCLLGLYPFEGSIQVGPHDVRRQGKQARRLMGVVPQELHFHDRLTVAETLAFYAALRRVAPAEAEERAHRFRLASFADREVGALSGGMKQRLALAIAMLGDPPILLLDEPTANLDLESRAGFLAFLRELKQAGKTLIFSSHHLEEVVNVAERAIVLEEGRITLDGPPADVRLRLGGGPWLWLALDPDRLAEAVQRLGDEGFAVERNGSGLRVRPRSADRKGEPVGTLERAGIPVHDFETLYTAAGASFAAPGAEGDVP
jgi:ABC-type multidrug transport system ATPase subunit